MSAHRPLRGEEGASLILALAFLTLFSVILISLMGLASASSKNTVVTRHQVGQRYAADGGIEWGVQKLDDPNVCPKDASQDGLGSFTTEINGKAVIVECLDTDYTETTTPTGGGGLSPIMNGYAVVIRKTGGLKIRGTDTGAPTNLFEGNVWSRGTVSAPSGSHAVINGVLTMYSSAACPPNVDAISCARDKNTPPTVPATPQVVIPPTAPPSKPHGPNCTILYPGKHAQAPQFNTTNTYMASGTYYFSNGEFIPRGTVFGGKAGPGETQAITGAAPCANDADAESEAGGSAIYNASTAGTGVTIIIGQNSVFRVSDPNARVELFSRVAAPGTSEAGTATPHISIWGRGEGKKDGANPKSAYTSLGNGTTFRLDNKRATVVIHGATYLPESEAWIAEPLNAAAPAGGLFMGGLVSGNLHMQLEGNGSSAAFARVAGGSGGTETTTTPTQTVLRATTAGTNTTITAVIDRTTNPPTIKSWRQG